MAVALAHRFANKAHNPDIDTREATTKKGKPGSSVGASADFSSAYLSKRVFAVGT